MTRPSSLFVVFLSAVTAAAMGLATALTLASDGDHGMHLDAMRAQVAHLGLTDLCLFTEAGYTRHLSQADGHAAFQNHPLALEHFPSGSITVPPLLHGGGGVGGDPATP
ncbi:MAG TPA: hypothetical protein VLT88_02625 [Desulfosarcina sp.]|nr:hypothetical protein [Desulfosarcina sp.]